METLTIFFHAMEKKRTRDFPLTQASNKIKVVSVKLKYSWPKKIKILLNFARGACTIFSYRKIKNSIQYF